MAEQVNTNQFKNGNHIDVDGVVYKIVEFQHVKPGKGGAFVRTKLRRSSDGAVIDRTFRAGEKFRAVHTEARKMQFLYAEGEGAHFMDLGSYEQIEVPQATIASSLQWVRPSDEVEVLFIDDAPSDLQLPISSSSSGVRSVAAWASARVNAAARGARVSSSGRPVRSCWYAAITAARR